MSHVRHCPEFQLARSDSKNPATTCRGLTANGQRCRRLALVASPKYRQQQQQQQQKDRISKDDGNLVARTPQELFCWQHQDQAGTAVTVAASSTNVKIPAPLRGRSSLDTLVERVGLLDVQDNGNGRVDAVRVEQVAATTTTTTAAGKVAGGHPAINDRIAVKRTPREYTHVRPPPDSQGAPKPERKRKSRRRLICFATSVDEDEDDMVIRLKNREKSRHSYHATSNNPNGTAKLPRRYSAQQQQQQRPSSTGHVESGRRHSHLEPTSRPASRPTNYNQRSHLAPPQPHHLTRPSISASPHGRRPSSQTESLLSWIPSTLPPDTTSKLLQKLAEPLSAADVPGYIYIYCATPNDSLPRADQTASLIPSPETPDSARDTSDIMHQAGIPPTSRVKRRNPSKRNSGDTTNTITLKIGRAVNVYRRLTQQQCSQNLTLVRYYPYQSSSHASTGVSQKAPNVHRLERLVHLELTDIRVKPEQACSHCGKKHQEFFEIEATKEQLKRVDECVRRWVDFSLRHPNV